MGRKKPDLTSALPPLCPELIVDVKTGEFVEQVEFEKTLTKLISFVRAESERLWAENKGTLQETLKTITATSPAEVGRQAALVIDWDEETTRDVKAKSRIERLIRYQTITSAKSYFESDVETKEEPTFSPYLNLGAVDAQMVSLTLVDSKIEMIFKCWDRAFLLTFSVPAYVLSTKNIDKITLPTVRSWGEGWGFGFSVFETSAQPIINPNYVMGIDLGRIEPFTLAVIHVKSGWRVAQATASPRLRILIAKRDRLNEELGHLYHKSKAYESLGLPRDDVLEQERILTRAKRNRLLNKISWLIATEIEQVAHKYSPQYVALEDLSWVNPTKGMSRWTHSKDQKAITHKLSRSGLKTRKVSAKNTSQDCYKCGSKITHKPGKRLIVCVDCSITLDRDLNAAINIALRPLPKRSKGSNCTEHSEVTVVNHSNKRLLTRNTS